MNQPSMCPVCQSRIWRFMQEPVPHHCCSRCSGSFVAAQQRGLFLRHVLQLNEATFLELVQHQGTPKHFCTQCGGRMMGVNAKGVDIQTCTSCATFFFEKERPTSGALHAEDSANAALVSDSGLDLDDTNYQKSAAQEMNAVQSRFDQEGGQASLPLGRSPYPTTQARTTNQSDQGQLSDQKAHTPDNAELKQNRASTMERPQEETAQESQSPYPALKKVTFQNPYEDDQVEAWVRALTLPITSLLALMMVVGDTGRSFLKTVFGMYIHELGHASTAWLCGYPALPRLWVTSWSNERSLMVSFIMGILLMAWGLWSYTKERWLSVLTAFVFFLTMLVATFGLTTHEAQKWITFGGDAGAMIWGTMLISTLYVERTHRFHIGWLRFGFLIIGVMAFVSASYTWWASLYDFANIPFGLQEYAGLSDSSKLVEIHGWTASQLIHRHLYVSVLCMLFMSGQYGYHLWRVRHNLQR